MYYRLEDILYVPVNTNRGLVLQKAAVNSTKVKNGVTYRLNENHRWEKVNMGQPLSTLRPKKGNPVMNFLRAKVGESLKQIKKIGTLRPKKKTTTKFNPTDRAPKLTPWEAQQHRALNQIQKVLDANVNFAESFTDKDGFEHEPLDDVVEKIVADNGLPGASVKDMIGDASKDELAAIRTYTYVNGRNYRDMNKLLRNGVLEDDVESEVEVRQCIEKAVEGLTKMPTYQGNVYRSILLKPDALDVLLNNYRLGETVLDPAFSSTSATPEGAFEGGNVNFEIKSKTGVYVAPISAIPEEHEVLFKPNTKFKINKISSYSIEGFSGEMEPHYIIEMEEI